MVNWQPMGEEGQLHAQRPRCLRVANHAALRLRQFHAADGDGFGVQVIERFRRLRLFALQLQARKNVVNVAASSSKTTHMNLRRIGFECFDDRRHASQRACVGIDVKPFYSQQRRR